MKPLALLSAITLSACAGSSLRNGCMVDALKARHELEAAALQPRIILTIHPGHAFVVWMDRGNVWGYDASQGSRIFSQDPAVLENPRACAARFLPFPVQSAHFEPSFDSRAALP